MFAKYERLIGYGVNAISFSPDGNTIAVARGDRFVDQSLDLDKLLERGCNQVQDYLKNNPKAKSDRTLCDGISTQK
jgi:hypothetical protein